MDAAKQKVKAELVATAELMQSSSESEIPETASAIASAIFEVMSRGGKLLLAGNGGSAADAQHIAAEFVNYFSFPRKALPAIALTTDTSVLTSISNDTDFNSVFARQIEAIGNQGDIVWLYTTSGTSKNIVEAAKTAKLCGLKVVCFTGANVETLREFTDYVISVPSNSTPKIQEVHLTIGHAISGLVESMFFSSND
jgi:D-sedoheptulose 7-phosphate isomerase